MAPNCIVPNTIGATNGSVIPLKYGIDIFTNIANSIVNISNIGRLNDFSTKNIINRIAIIDEELTLLKSSSLIVTKSFIRGPSPANKAFLSYLFIIF